MASEGVGVAKSRGCGKRARVAVGGMGEGVQVDVAGMRVRVGSGEGTAVGAQAHKQASSAQQAPLAILRKELGFNLATGQAFDAENLVTRFSASHYLDLGRLNA